MMFCIILIILDFSVLSRQNMKIKKCGKQTNYKKQYSAYAKMYLKNSFYIICQNNIDCYY